MKVAEFTQIRKRVTSALSLGFCGLEQNYHALWDRNMSYFFFCVLNLS